MVATKTCCKCGNDEGMDVPTMPKPICKGCLEDLVWGFVEDKNPWHPKRGDKVEAWREDHLLNDLEKWIGTTAWEFQNEDTAGKLAMILSIVFLPLLVPLVRMWDWKKEQQKQRRHRELTVEEFM